MARKATVGLAVERLKQLDQAERLELLQLILSNACEPDTKVLVERSRAVRRSGARAQKNRAAR